MIFQPQDTVENVSISIEDNGVVEELEVFIVILGILPGEDGVAPGQEMTRVTIVDDNGMLKSRSSSSLPPPLVSFLLLLP